MLPVVHLRLCFHCERLQTALPRQMSDGRLCFACDGTRDCSHGLTVLIKENRKCEIFLFSFSSDQGQMQGQAPLGKQGRQDLTDKCKDRHPRVNKAEGTSRTDAVTGTIG